MFRSFRRTAATSLAVLAVTAVAVGCGRSDSSADGGSGEYATPVCDAAVAALQNAFGTASDWETAESRAPKTFRAAVRGVLDDCASTDELDASWTEATSGGTLADDFWDLCQEYDSGRETTICASLPSD